MRIILDHSIENDPKHTVGPAVKKDVYYDRVCFRTWVARWIDANGNQVGECVYGHKKQWALDALPDLEGR